jgi:tryptophan halogenase
MSDLSASPVRHVVVVGNGLTGVTVAAALKRRLPELAVTLLSGRADLSPSMVDHLPCALPSINDFHADLGIDDADAVAQTASVYRLGTLMTDWVAGLPDYMHDYGIHGPSLPGGSFHLHWTRAHRQGATPAFDSLAAGAALARAGSFASPVPSAQDPFGRYGYGLTIDPPRYLAMMEAFARHVGVRVDDREVTDCIIEADSIAALSCADGTAVSAGLYVDCTGPSALIRAVLGDDWEDWRDWLPCDRLISCSAPLQTLASSHDKATTWRAGWCWSATSARCLHRGVVYHSAAAPDDEARNELGLTDVAAPSPIAFAAGTRPAPWRANCIAIGEAATVIEPLGWAPLHLVHSAIDRLVMMFPDHKITPALATLYNREAHAEAQRVRDFVLLHYAISSRPETFWQRWREAALPPSLTHTLALFRDRGRLPFYEHETFSRDEWLAVLIGQGCIPRRIDPLIQSYPAAEAARSIIQWHAAIEAGVAARSSNHPPSTAQYGYQGR